MSARADLTGLQIAEWAIVEKAQAQDRKPFWTAEHACGQRVDLAHTLLVPVTKGKTVTLPPCQACTPADELPDISHGMHGACGQYHLVGTPCGKAGPGECKHGLGWSTCFACSPGAPVERPADGAYADPYEPKVIYQGEAVAEPAAYAVERLEGGGVVIRPEVCRVGHELYGSCELTYRHDGPHSRIPGGATEANTWHDGDAGTCACTVGQPCGGAVIRPQASPILALDLADFAEPAHLPAAELDLEALAAEPLPPVLTLDLAALVSDADDYTLEQAYGGIVDALGWQITDAKAPAATLNREFRDFLLAPMYEAMGSQARNGQAKPGPSGVGGCRRKLAHQLLYQDEFVPAPSGWAAMKGTVLHAWYDELCSGREGWFSDLALPASVECITGGKLDLYVDRRIVDLKAPGTSTMKEARAGRLSNGYFVQTQVYGLGAEMLGLVVEKVGLLFVPMCGDNLDDAIYWEWDYDPSVARSALADAERIVELRKSMPRAEVLAAMPTRSDFCQGCAAFGKHCAGAAAPKVAAPAALELVRA